MLFKNIWPFNSKKKKIKEIKERKRQRSNLVINPGFSSSPDRWQMIALNVAIHTGVKAVIEPDENPNRVIIGHTYNDHRTFKQDLFHGLVVSVNFEGHIMTRMYFFEGTNVTEDVLDLGINLENINSDDEALINLVFSG